VAALAAVTLSAVLPRADRVLALSLANSIGMLALGTLLVVVVRRRAGAAALTGLPRAAGVGIVAAVAAGLAGWGAVEPLRHAAGPTPPGWVSLLSGMLGGVVVAVVFLAVTYPLDRHDLRPLVATVTRRIRRGPAPERQAPASASAPGQPAAEQPAAEQRTSGQQNSDGKGVS
jgi:putative peptidoglycan lipid II flippase